MKTLVQFVLLATLSVFTTLLAGTVLAEDQSPLYGELLQHYVNDGQVDYSGLKKKEAQLDGYLAYLATTDPTQMAENDQFALYINAYNAYTIKLILANFEDGRPPASIKVFLYNMHQQSSKKNSPPIGNG